LKTAALRTASAAVASAVPKKLTESSETLVTTVYQLFPGTENQIAFPFDHPLRSKVDNNWHIVPQKIGTFFSADQQAMVEEIFRGLHNPDFVEKVLAHMKEDDKGLPNYSVALFGEPGSGAFEFVLTGRHCAARCDCDSVAGTAFGGPIFYGHQAGPTFEEKPDHLMITQSYLLTIKFPVKGSVVHAQEGGSAFAALSGVDMLPGVGYLRPREFRLAPEISRHGLARPSFRRGSVH
jgi:hypothetical protein